MGSNSDYWAVLEIPEFSRQVHLGCLPEERSASQEVRFHIKIAFKKQLSAELTDELGETVCYAKLSEKISHLLEGKEFKLVEKLARDVYDEVHKLLPELASLNVRVHKVNPPIDMLTHGVYYTTGDLSL